MKTEVIMKRELFGYEISQKSKSEFLSATDLVRAGNYYRSLNREPLFSVESYYKSIEFKEFEKTLKEKYGEVRQIGRGRGSQHSWVHPLIFIDIALKISPALKVEVYEWVIDNLLKYRNESGVSYKKMCGILFQKTKSPSTFHKFIEKVADKIRLACNVEDWNKATEEQLKKRDKIQDNISLLADILNDVEKAVELAIIKAIN
jgi:hypothetical protein